MSVWMGNQGTRPQAEQHLRGQRGEGSGASRERTEGTALLRAG